MIRLVLTEQKEAEEAIRAGERLAVFAVGEDGKPVRRVSGIFSEGNVATGKTETVRRILDYMEQNYDKEIRLTDIAEFCEGSVSKLCRLFGAETGQTPIEYVLSVKMNQAARLLTETDRKVVDIAREVGYDDCGYFHKRFKKFFGMTPVEYRQKNSGSL